MSFTELGVYVAQNRIVVICLGIANNISEPELEGVKLSCISKSEYCVSGLKLAKIKQKECGEEDLSTCHTECWVT